ncbi:MAG: hypothetical protein ABSE73_00055 [Planctomycetota bacterium]
MTDPFEHLELEDRLGGEVPDETPEMAALRELVQVSVQRGMAQMDEACAAHGPLDYVGVLEQHIASASNGQANYEDTGLALGWSVAKVKRTLRRDRMKFAAALRQVLRKPASTGDDELLTELRRYID